MTQDEGEQTSQSEQEAKSNIDTVRHRIMVMSGKGGVGKSTVAANLAMALAMLGRDVGLLDADVTGPNIPKMLHIEDKRPVASEEGLIQPVEIPIGTDHSIKVMSLAFFLEEGAPVIWRGPLKMKALDQFINEVGWGDADYLIADLPPGTSDEPLSIAQLLKPHGALIVTTPQDVAIMDVVRAVKMAKVLNVPILGVIENMSSIVCPHCGEVFEVFGSGGGKKMAEELGIPFLGSIPLDPEIASSGDKGIPFVVEANSSSAKTFEDIASKVVESLKGHTA
ncbi:MAG: Mrp/NBP35 family ATP-binding protein [Methermicoccaceae archaeon]